MIGRLDNNIHAYEKIYFRNCLERYRNVKLKIAQKVVKLCGFAEVDRPSTTVDPVFGPTSVTV